MKFLADINIPQSVINRLIELEHNVLDIKKENLALPDTEIIQRAKKEKRTILTRDKDFLGLTQFPQHQVPTIVIRLRNQTPDYILSHLLQLLENQEQSTLEKSLTIITEDSADSHPYS